MIKKRKTILKLQQIVSLGYVPSRGSEIYTGYTQRFEKVEDMTNCFGHAIFNLKNKQFDDINFTYSDGTNLGSFVSSPFLPKENVEYDFCGFVRETGLKIYPESKDKLLKNNEWLVALYFEKHSDDLSREFHWLLKEKRGIWSGKLGYTKQVQTFYNLPREIGDKFELHKTYVVKNPFAKE